MLRSTMTVERWVALTAVVVAGTVGGVTGLWLGKHNQKVQTVEVEKRVEVQKETQIIQQKVDLTELMQAVQTMSKQADVHREITVERKPDGTYTRKEVDSDRSTVEQKSETTASKTSTTTTQAQIWKETVRVEEHIQYVAATPQKWSLALGAGYAVPTLWGSSPGFNIIPTPGLVVDAEIARRLGGPFWLGLHATSTGVAGLRLRVQW